VKIAIESTTKIVTLNGVPARVWEGETESGVPVVCFITRIAVEKSFDSSEFDAELQEHRHPSADVAMLPIFLTL
jgi:hypothetical protein